MSLDLSICTQECFTCIKAYKGKHDLLKGQEFKIKCDGITDLDSDPYLFAGLTSDETLTAKEVLDPVLWASRTLDWHCLDPDGEIWKRKNPKEYYDWLDKNPGVSILGKSRYHRPYQAEMLQCTSRRKVFRLGRQAGKTEAIVVSMLFHMFVKPGKTKEDGFEIIVITPYQSQIDLIFTRLMHLIRSAPGVANSIKRNVKAPIYAIELHNNSIIKGFTAGTKSGGNAESVRGQHGDMLVFDEADYLSKGDMDAAFSIVTNYPDASVWMSSTPSGKREKFYETCHSKLWKEYFYPSTVNPMWNEDLEEMFREQLTELAYVHEIEAKFGEQEQGVFQTVYVDAAQRQYEYNEMKRDPDWIYTMGVDWNDVKNGTTIAVYGYDPYQNRFTIVDKAIVSREGWNQLAACQKVVEMNKAWRPKSIYLDSGYGGTQFEVLKKYGWDATHDKARGPNHPDAQLRFTLKQYDSGSKIEVRDLWTGQPANKPAKPFLVENLVRRFESGDIVYPKSDEAFTKQLLGYIIERTTPSGTHVYGASDKKVGDHFLDAVMLAAVAFTLEQTPFGKRKYSTAIAFSGRLGEKTDALVTPGDTIIKPELGKRGEQRRDSKPEGNRTETSQVQSILNPGTGLPANNTTNSSILGSIGIWSWPGFGHDAPRPIARRIKKSRISDRPSRKNI